MLIDIGDDREEDVTKTKKKFVFQKLKSKTLLSRIGENLNETGSGGMLQGLPTNIYEYLKMRLDDEMIHLT